MIGIREYAIRFGSGFKAIDEEELSRSDASITVGEGEQDHPSTEMGKNVTYSLFAYPAEDNFAGVKYPLDWIEKIRNGYFHDVMSLHPLNSRVTNGSFFSMLQPSFPQIVWTFPSTNPISSASPSTSSSATQPALEPCSSGTRT